MPYLLACEDNPHCRDYVIYRNQKETPNQDLDVGARTKIRGRKRFSERRSQDWASGDNEDIAHLRNMPKQVGQWGK